MKFAIRDDDTCFFTEPAEIERVYGRIWSRAPVCLATVPFAMGYPRKGIPERHWSGREAFALERNAELSSALRQWLQERRISLALHGYTHEDYPDGYEFQAAPDPERRLRDGRAYLESQLGGSISIFVPPHNALSRRGLLAVSQARLNLLGSFISFRPSMRPWDARTAANWWRVSHYRSQTRRSRRDSFVYPHVLRYTRHSEFGCHSLVPGVTALSLIRAFEEARVAGGDFCIATHYWEVDGALADALDAVLDHAASCPGVRFVAAETLFA